MISARAVGAQPTSQTAPGPASPCASRTAAALSVMFAVRASRAAQRVADLADHRVPGDAGGDHGHVRDDRRVAAQRRHPGRQRRLVADQVGDVVEVGGGVDDPLGHRPGQRGQRAQVDPGPQDPVRLGLDGMNLGHGTISIASAGQISTHSPHSVHSSPRTTSGPAPGRIACSGQVSRHAPQPQHSVVTTGVTARPTGSRAGSPSGRPAPGCGTSRRRPACACPPAPGRTRPAC